jgi:hypothetical protein
MGIACAVENTHGATAQRGAGVVTDDDAAGAEHRRSRLQREADQPAEAVANARRGEQAEEREAGDGELCGRPSREAREDWHAEANARL